MSQGPLGSNNSTDPSSDRPAYQTSTLHFITVAKLQLGSSNKNNVLVGDQHSMRIVVLEGYSIEKVEKHWLSERKNQMVEIVKETAKTPVYSERK